MQKPNSNMSRAQYLQEVILRKQQQQQMQQQQQQQMQQHYKQQYPGQYGVRFTTSCVVSGLSNSHALNANLPVAACIVF